MKDCFDNRKHEKKSARRKHGGGGGLRGTMRTMLDPESKRGAKLRFRLLCAVAFIFLLAFLMAMHLHPQGANDVDSGLRDDILGGGKSGRAKLLLTE